MTEASHISTGKQGENIAAGYLTNRGFHLVEQNYRKKWGEIDIVALKDGVLHFVEVKSTACGTFPPSEGVDRHRPEDHMHAHKRARLVRAISTYLSERQVTMPYTVDLVVVYLNDLSKRARVHVLWDIVL